MSKLLNQGAWSTTVSIFCVGGMIGGLLSGQVADVFGRRGGMLLNNIFAFVGAALLGCSKVVDAWPILVLGRLVIGFNCGEICNNHHKCNWKTGLSQLFPLIARFFPNETFP